MKRIKISSDAYIIETKEDFESLFGPVDDFDMSNVLISLRSVDPIAFSPIIMSLIKNKDEYVWASIPLTLKDVSPTKEKA